MEFTLAQLAEITGAQAAGEAGAAIRRVRPFDQAVPGDITLAAEEKLRARIRESSAAAFIVADARSLEGVNLLVHSRPKLVFARLIRLFAGAPAAEPGISSDFSPGVNTRLGQSLTIHPRVTVGRDCSIGDRSILHSGVAIGDRVRIGEDTVIHSNVAVYSDVGIGSRVIIHSGTVIGAEGFGFVTDEEGRQFKILQTGRVEIEDDVEIGANCCIDRATFGVTRIARGVKLDNLIQVGHNCVIGENTVVAALTGFSGGTVVGRGVIIAGGVGTNPHIQIGDGVLVMGQAGVTKDVPRGLRVAGTPAREERVWKRATTLFYRLPELLDRIQRLEQMKADGPAEKRRRGELPTRRHGDTETRRGGEAAPVKRRQPGTRNPRPGTKNPKPGTRNQKP